MEIVLENISSIEIIVGKPFVIENKLTMENISHIKLPLEDVYKANSINHKNDGIIIDNYKNYLEDPLRIGFMEQFPVKTVLESYEINDKVRGFDVTYNVHYCYRYS